MPISAAMCWSLLLVRADGLWTAAILNPDGFDLEADQFEQATRFEVSKAAQFADLVDDDRPELPACPARTVLQN